LPQTLLPKAANSFYLTSSAEVNAVDSHCRIQFLFPLLNTRVSGCIRKVWQP